MPPLKIAGRTIGRGNPCFVIAEAGVNHNGRLDLACQLIDAAAEAGADAVKFQTFRAAELVTRDAPKAAYQRTPTDLGETQFTMLQRLELDLAAHRTLLAHAAARGIIFLSTPFDEPSAALLTSLYLPALKISSGEVTNLPFLETLARLGRPLLLSTGMSTLAEVAAAVATIRGASAVPFALLHCVSNYPAEPAASNLRAMQTMADAFDVPIGFSDHALGLEVALASVALGACVLEKHLTLDRTLPGPDQAASSTPEEFRQLVRSVRTIEEALGDGVKKPAASEASTAAVVRRSLVAARDLRAGEALDGSAIIALRPSGGLPPSARASLLQRRVRQPIAAGTVLTLEMLE